MNYYYRDFYSEELSDPMRFDHADKAARKLSKENESGVAELLTYYNGQLFIVATYCRGTKRYQGKKSRDAKRENLPPYK